MQNGCDVPKNNNKNIILQIALIVSQNEANGNIFITLVVYVKHMKKSEWLDCQRNEFFPKQKGIPSLVKIEHKNTATLDSARSKKKSKVAVLQLDLCRPDDLGQNCLQVYYHQKTLVSRQRVS